MGGGVRVGGKNKLECGLALLSTAPDRTGWIVYLSPLTPITNVLDQETFGATCKVYLSYCL